MLLKLRRPYSKGLAFLLNKNKEENGKNTLIMAGFDR